MNEHEELRIEWERLNTEGLDYVSIVNRSSKCNVSIVNRSS